MIQEIYCDESGTTGNNLLHKGQPYFAYGSIAISNEEADEFVKKIIKDYRIQGSELKGKNLLKFNKGRYAATEVLKTYKDLIQVTIFHKKYNLACKFFEYIFEPLISEKNSAFYTIGFHKFIANLLFLHFDQGARHAEEIFSDFENFMRKKNNEGPSHLFTPLALPKISPALDLIQRFSAYHRDAISKELDSLFEHGIGGWILDLTFEALFTHLAEWGEKFHQLRVFCDNAKPLETDKDILKVMVDREEKLYNQFEDRRQAITFNLAEEIKLVDSKNYPGVQLADVAAGSMIYMLQEKDCKHSKKWKEFALEIISPLSVMPDYESIDLETFEAQRNYVLLHELVERSKNKQPLLDNLGEYLAVVSAQLRINPISFA